MPYTRRTFLMAGAAGVAAAAMSRTKASAAERVRHAVIGTGGQGREHVLRFDANEECQVVAVCDIDPERRKQAAAEVKHGPAPKQYEDFRELLEREPIDSVSVATPDHWHVPVALHALAAGKHVYVEKPCCHNIREGEALVEAARKTGLCVQHGTQSRSGGGIREAIQLLHEGGIGKVRCAKAINHQFREPIGRASEEPAPVGVNYDLWTGPAPLRPFTKNRWHYNWHWLWDFGTGDMGNDGVHQIDVARWGLGVGLPNAVSASGGQLFYNDDHETPDTQVVTFEYEGAYLIYEMRLWTNYPLEGHDNGNVFYGDNGKLEIGRDGCEVTLIGEEKKKIGDGADIAANMRNFIDCVKASDPSKLNAPVEAAFESATLCHLGNIATRVGRKLTLETAEPLRCKGDDEATALFARMYRKGYELPKVG